MKFTIIILLCFVSVGQAMAMHRGFVFVGVPAVAVGAVYLINKELKVARAAAIKRGEKYRKHIKKVEREERLQELAAKNRRERFERKEKLLFQLLSTCGDDEVCKRQAWHNFYLQ